METITLEDDRYITELEQAHNRETALLRKLIEERNRLVNEARIDPLTGIYNRNIIGKIREYATVVVMDIDYFKTINDTYGHAEGDRVLHALAQILQRHVRFGDAAIRDGGDEFLLVYSNDISDSIEARLNEIRREARGISKDYAVTLSIGVAIKKEGEKIDDVKARADKALYDSKNNGKDQITIYRNDKVLKRGEKQ